jgi:hypothetical protein
MEVISLISEEDALSRVTRVGSKSMTAGMLLP